MSERCAVAVLALRERAQKLGDPRTKVNRQAQNRAQLNHDGVHLPVTIRQADVKQRLGNPQMRRGADRQKLRQPFDDAEDDGQQVVVQETSADVDNAAWSRKSASRLARN